MAARATRRGFLRRLAGAAEAESVARIGRSCLALGGVFCQSCADACGPRAIRFIPLPGRPPVPVVADERCTACGDCAGVCPVAAIELATPAHA